MGGLLPVGVRSGEAVVIFHQMSLHRREPTTHIHLTLESKSREAMWAMNKKEKRLHIIVFAPSFEETVGGIIALHLLCERLNKLGVRASIWPATKPAGLNLLKWKSIRNNLSYCLKPSRRIYSTGPFKNPVARRAEIKDAVVVYPEVIGGNPLGARRIVRWFLHKPGFHTGEIAFGEDELYFFYGKVFNDESINKNADNLLHVTFLNPAYRQHNFGPRQGSCYIVRKGRDRVLDQHPKDSIFIDELSHAEKAEVFNRVAYMYSYDPYTFYCTYAAICGCVPIIIPEEGVSKEQWWPERRRRLGLAYGQREVDAACKEREMLLAYLDTQVEEENELVRRFVDKCRRFFATER